MTWRRVAVQAVVVVGAGLIVQVGDTGPAAAAATVEVTRQVAATPYTADATKDVAVSCPDGMVATGGGAAVRRLSSAQVVVIQRVVPDTLRPGYLATASALAPTTGMWGLEVHAICARGLTGYEIRRSAEALVDPFQLVDVPCLGGRRALSAGVLTSSSVFAAGGAVMIRPDGPLTIGRATVRTLPDRPYNAFMYTYVICADPVPGLRAHTAVAAGRFAQVYCPEGQLVLGAGGGGSPYDVNENVYLSAVQPVSNLKGVQVRMTADYPGGMVAHATCADARAV
jgi:hypothetical protein